MKRRPPRAKAQNTSSTPALQTSTSKKISAYDPECQQHLVDHGLRLDDKHGKPNNFEYINERLQQARPSLSPSRCTENEFEKFRQLNKTAIGETKVASRVIGMLLGESDILSEENIIFNNLEPLTDGSLVDAKPDLYDGAVPESLDPDIRKELGSYIVPSKQSHAPILPNFFLEIKGPDGSPAVVNRQIAIDMHLGSRGMKAIQDYGTGSNSNDGNASTFGSTYIDGHLRLHTAHEAGPARSRKSRPTGSMTQPRAFAMTDKPDTYFEGKKNLRNMRNLAREMRNEAIKNANERLEENRRQGTVIESESQLPLNNALGNVDPPSGAHNGTPRPGPQAAQKPKQRQQLTEIRRSSRRTAATSNPGGPSNANGMIQKSKSILGKNRRNESPSQDPTSSTKRFRDRI